MESTLVSWLYFLVCLVGEQGEHIRQAQVGCSMNHL